MNIYPTFVEKKGKQKQLAVLIDPDLGNLNKLTSVVENATKVGVDLFFVGGSLVLNDSLDRAIKLIKEVSSIPVVLFPGSPLQMSPKADAILFLSLISGRNPDLLIGSHVLAAPYLKLSGLEVISTGYMLIDGGVATSVSYISNTQPIPANKPNIAVSTALAGQYLGLKTIYMDAGSGALNHVPSAMVEAVRAHIDVPIIVGGGIRTPDAAAAIASAGADIIVVGNAFEKDPELIADIAAAVHSK
jgi:putative glycerol-1-phosphate prenyltransferase